MNIPSTETSSNPNVSSSKHVAAAAGQYLTFRLGTEEYGIDILGVQEIRSFEPPTHIPNSSEFIKGVIDLRGHILPIFDLRLKLQYPHVDYSDLTVVIVLDIGEMLIGVVVDGVADVISLKDDDIKPAPLFERIQGSADSEFIKGIVSISERMLIIVDIEALLGNDEINVMRK